MEPSPQRAIHRRPRSEDRREGSALLAFLGGTWSPIPDHGVLHVVGQLLPSCWLVQAGHVALGGAAWGRQGWLIVFAWSLVLARLAMGAFERDTARV